MNTKFDVGQRVTCPIFTTADGEITGIAVSKTGVTRYAIGAKWYAEDDLKPTAEGNPVTEPVKNEPMKLYCVKSYAPGEWITKGKIYELDAKGQIHFDDGCTRNWKGIKEDTPHSSVATSLFPLVRRPAKVGEWVYIERDNGGWVKPGTIWEVIKTRSDYLLLTKNCVCSLDNYLVIDGYHGGAES